MNYEDSLLDESVCKEIDEVLASPDLALRLEEGERLRRIEANRPAIALLDGWLAMPTVERPQPNEEALKLFKNLEQLAQRLHKNLRQDCINLALADVLELKNILCRAIYQEEEK